MPAPTTLLHCATIVISAVVTGLATVNFGILSIWINASAGFLTLAYHVTILVLNYLRDRRGSSIPKSNQHAVVFEKPTPFVTGLKMPTTPSPTYVPPPYEALAPNRRPISHLPRKSKGLVINIGSGIPSGPFYSLLSLLIISFLEILSIVGIIMTVEVSMNGALSIPQPDRAKGMTFPWNMKVQKAQCTFLGILTLLGLVAIYFCVKGRSEISRVEDEKREEIEYGFASPESTHRPASDWSDYGV